MCDVPIGVRVSGGGVSGEAGLVIRGTGTATEPDTLLVSASPDVLAPGERATVTAKALTEDACAVRGGVLPDSTRMTVMVPSAEQGLLEYDGTQGVVLNDVPYGALRAGGVQFVAASDSTGSACGIAWIGVFGAGVSGETSILVEDDSATPDSTNYMIAPMVPPAAVVADSTGGGEPVCETPPSDLCGARPDWERVRRAIALDEALESNPYGLLPIPCDHIPAWGEVGRHTAPASVIAELRQRQESEPCWNISPAKWEIEDLHEARGGRVNMDYYPINVEFNPSSGMTPEAFFERMRRNLNDYLDHDVSEFRFYGFQSLPGEPYAGSAEERSRWVSGQVVGTVGVFDINTGINIDDAAVVASEYIPGRRWRFMTLETPGTFGHPVSGVREFGITSNGDGSYTVYTRGVDRVTGWLDVVFGFKPGDENRAFVGGDALWRSWQARVAAEVSELFGTATVTAPVVHRTDWDDVRRYFEGYMSLDALLWALGCSP